MMQREENPYAEGKVLLINKPLHWTSFDVVKKVRNLVKTKVGHAGTLDPLATGLLICCTGKFTKKIAAYQAQEKEYTGTITLGAVTPSYDLESTPQNFKPFGHLSENDLRDAAASFTGKIAQVPPAHSAIKQQGKPVYHQARKGIAVKLEPREIEIKAFEITGTDLPRVDFRVICSTGTYIRSLAHDFGQTLGCGAYLSTLCRTRIGTYRLEDALDLEAWIGQQSATIRRDTLPRN
jgi:tRNA pseudouridine55 synthase